MNNYVGYYRVSTEDQGKSGLGLEAQRSSIRTFVSQYGNLISEYQDVESGKSESRDGIELAIQACKLTNATLLVKELSRITRGGYKYRQMLEESNVNFIEVNSPHDPEIVKDIKFSLAKEERQKIKERTKSALNEIKKKLERGQKHISKSGNVVTSLGKPENLTELARQRSIQSRKRKALENPNNKMAGALIVTLRNNGCSYDNIVKELIKSGFKTSKGYNFSKSQVFNLYKRYK